LEKLVSILEVDTQIGEETTMVNEYMKEFIQRGEYQEIGNKGRRIVIETHSENAHKETEEMEQLWSEDKIEMICIITRDTTINRKILRSKQYEIFAKMGKTNTIAAVKTKPGGQTRNYRY
jgi:hypothetical protein